MLSNKIRLAAVMVIAVSATTTVEAETRLRRAQQQSTIDVCISETGPQADTVGVAAKYAASQWNGAQSVRIIVEDTCPNRPADDVVRIRYDADLSDCPADARIYCLRRRSARSRRIDEIVHNMDGATFPGRTIYYSASGSFAHAFGQLLGVKAERDGSGLTRDCRLRYDVEGGVDLSPGVYDRLSIMNPCFFEDQDNISDYKLSAEDYNGARHLFLDADENDLTKPAANRSGSALTLDVVDGFAASSIAVVDGRQNGPIVFAGAPFSKRAGAGDSALHGAMFAFHVRDGGYVNSAQFTSQLANAQSTQSNRQAPTNGPRKGFAT
ncbi:MAG: hypothetical protein AAGJ87_16280, partial [Pseudomonadota bacterium]